MDVGTSNKCESKTFSHKNKYNGEENMVKTIGRRPRNLGLNFADADFFGGYVAEEWDFFAIFANWRKI